MKKKSKETTLGSDRFFEIFAGEFVELTTDIKVKSATQTEDGQIISEFPVTIQGFLLEKDDRYYFIGSNPDEVESAIEINTVKAISIVKPKTPFDDILDEMPEPEHNEDLN